MPPNDPLDEMFDDTITDGDEPEVDLDIGEDDALDAGSGGGDISEPPADTKPPGKYAAGAAAIERAAARTKDRQDAVDVRDAWQKEIETRESRKRQLQVEWAEVRRKVRDGEADDAEEIEAQQAIWDAAKHVDEARAQHANAEQYIEHMEKNKPPQAQQAWLDANDRYYSDSTFQKQARDAYNRLISRAMDPTNPAFYDELDREMRKPQRLSGGNRRPGAAPSIRTSKTENARDGGNPMSRDLSKADRHIMSGFGMDPKNQRHKDAFNQARINLNKLLREQGRL